MRSASNCMASIPWPMKKALVSDACRVAGGFVTWDTYPMAYCISGLRPAWHGMAGYWCMWLKGLWTGEGAGAMKSTASSGPAQTGLK